MSLFANSGLQSVPNMSKQFRHPYQPYSDQTVTNQPIYNGTGYGQPVDNLSANMASMSVYGSWNQMLGQESVNLMTEKEPRTRHLMVERQKAAQTTNGYQTACTKEIMRSTLTKAPDSASLLQKARLPFGILIHPFKTDDVSDHNQQTCQAFNLFC